MKLAARCDFFSCARCINEKFVYISDQKREPSPIQKLHLERLSKRIAKFSIFLALESNLKSFQAMEVILQQLIVRTKTVSGCCFKEGYFRMGVNGSSRAYSKSFA